MRAFGKSARPVRRSLSVGCALLCSLARASASQGPAEPSQLAAVRQALAGGAYADAERAARSLASAVEADHGSESLEMARVQDALVEALVRNGHAGTPETLALAERAVALKERMFGRDHVETASSLHNLGSVRFERGEFGTAVSLHERALAARRGHFAPDDAAIADSLDFLVAALIRNERFDDARRRVAEALPIRESRSDQNPLALARTLELAAWLDRYTGRFAAAVSLADRALEIRRQHAPTHPDTAMSGELRGDLLWFRGDRPGARAVWSDAIASASRALGSDHPAVAVLERKTAMAAWAFGDRQEARRLLEHALKVADESSAPCQAERPKVLNDLAISYEHGGEYSAAYRMFERARSLYVRCLGPSHSLVATAMENQADLASLTGDFAEAERLHQRVVAARIAALGPTHVFVASALESLADVVAQRRQGLRAQSLYERALAIRERAQGGDHPNVAWTLTNLARIRFDLGSRAQAVRDLDRAMDIYRRAGSAVEQQPDNLAHALDLRAEMEARRGDYDAARATLEESLTIREAVFGRQHPRSVATRVELAAGEFAQGDTTAALDAALDAERDGRDHVRYTVRYLPERLATLYVAQRASGLDVALSIVAADHDLRPSDAFDALIQSRGVVLDELAARAQSTISPDPALAALNASLTTNRERFANLMLRSLREDGSVPRAALDDARQKMEESERALAERSAEVQWELARVHARIDDVRRALPPHSALVSFALYNRTVRSPDQARGAARTVPSYMVFVAHTDSAGVVAIPMGPAAAIDPIVRQWRAEASGGTIGERSAVDAEAAYRAVGGRLRARIWDPIAASLGGAAHVVIVPDGALNVVSFAALPALGRGYLGERYVFHYASTERDLIGGAAAPTGVRGLLAVGGPAFERSLGRETSNAVQATRAPAPLRASCGDLRSVRFEPLPGSQREATRVARIWSQAFSANPPSDDILMLTGASATERAVKNAVADRRVVHLATHGFFLGADCAPAPGTRGVGGISSGTSRRSPPVENPLLLSGLALAGANDRAPKPSGRDDGILTAEEVAGLNLHGTEWAVLSACDTGLGEIKAGEGVFGLRRAFQIAGARTVIMSLWGVDDQATEAWMTALYDRRFRQGLSTADAAHEANLSVLRARRARHQSTHPFYWAGFVAAGDWR